MVVILWYQMEVYAVCPEEIFEGLGALIVNAEVSGFEAPVEQVLDQPHLRSHQLLGFVVLKMFGQNGISVSVIKHHY